MQSEIRILRIYRIGRISLLIILILSSVVTIASPQPASSQQTDVSAIALAKADSLYSTKQYTQAFEHYQALYSGGRYSSSMLLKMAYIQEGLGHLGESLYYLNLYFLASNDAQALKKMEELAKKNNLEGYEASETIKLLAWLQEQYSTIAYVIATASVFLLALMFYQRTKMQTHPSLAGIGLAVTLAMLFFHINFNLKSERGIVAQSQTYLMSGPSAGSSLVAIIGEGHQLEIKGRQDVWLRVSWKQKEVFVKEFLVRPVRL